eukprot:TRINITY_DN7268_c0_g2_i3.p2 TRINITY_DN7268_c0_g2~~TRINITY_DN7268_c0_g2_i3.p2  ORF type:complete len:111 (+),score=16.73 TRINITY_DN7268_c0_g2_i3:47-334(+)
MCIRDRNKGSGAYTMQGKGPFYSMSREDILPREFVKVPVISKEERAAKIAKYKGKLKKWRESRPIKRRFPGRSGAAQRRQRVKGRFARKVPVHGI